MQSDQLLVPPFTGSRVSVEEVIIPPRSVLRGHRHPGAHVCVVLAGSFEERDAGGVRRRCEPGSLRISAPGQGHSIRFGIHGAHCLLFLMPRRWPRAHGLFPSPGAGDMFRFGEGLSRLAALARAEAHRGRADSPILLEKWWWS